MLSETVQGIKWVLGSFFLKSLYILFFVLFFYIYFFHHDGQWEDAPKDFFLKWDQSFFTGFQVFSIVEFNVGHYAPSQKVDTPYGIWSFFGNRD